MAHEILREIKSRRLFAAKELEGWLKTRFNVLKSTEAKIVSGGQVWSW